MTLDTSISHGDLRQIVAVAAEESTGDMWDGHHRFELARSDEKGELWVVKNLFGKGFRFSFYASFVDTGRIHLSTTIANYITTRPTYLGIPIWSATMVAHNAYIQFCRKVANTVVAADPTAKIQLRDAGGAAAAPAGGPLAIERPAGVVAPNPPLDNTPQVEPPPTELARRRPPPPPPQFHLSVAASDLLDDETHRVSRRGLTNWTLSSKDWSDLVVVASTVVGRHPQPVGAHDSPLAVVDESVSHTHARFTLSEGTLSVTDLGSRNGTWITLGDGTEFRCLPNIPREVGDGASIALGDFEILIAEGRAR